MGVEFPNEEEFYFSRYNITSAVNMIYLYFQPLRNERGIFMFKNALKLRKMSTKELCIIAMLVAITVVLSFISGYLRTPVGKLNISFVSVYVTAALFGPFAGGLVGALADLISVWVSASGAPIPLFTVIEFVNGFVFGLFFFRSDSKSRPVWKTVVFAALCVVIQYIINLLRVPVLAGLQHLTLMETFIMRIPSTTLMLVVKFAGIILVEPYIRNLKSIVKK